MQTVATRRPCEMSRLLYLYFVFAFFSRKLVSNLPFIQNMTPIQALRGLSYDDNRGISSTFYRVLITAFENIKIDRT